MHHYQEIELTAQCDMWSDTQSVYFIFIVTQFSEDIIKVYPTSSTDFYVFVLSFVYYLSLVGFLIR